MVVITPGLACHCCVVGLHAMSGRNPRSTYIVSQRTSFVKVPCFPMYEVGGTDKLVGRNGHPTAHMRIVRQIRHVRHVR